MNASHKTEIINGLRQDIAAKERELAATVAQKEGELAEYRRLLAWVESQAASDATISAEEPGDGETESVNGDGHANNGELTVKMILDAAYAAIRDAGQPLKAVDIIRRRIKPDYDPQDDEGRVLENRVYSALKRSDKFEKVGRGDWMLINRRT